MNLRIVGSPLQRVRSLCSCGNPDASRDSNSADWRSLPMRVSSRLKLLVAACFTAASAQSANWGAGIHPGDCRVRARGLSTAEEHDRAALAVAESFEKNDLRLEATLTNLGAVVQARKGCCEAEPLLRRALEIRVSNFGRNSVEPRRAKTTSLRHFFKRGE